MRFEPGTTVQPEPGKGYIAWPNPLKEQAWWQWLLGLPGPVYTVVSNRYQSAANQIGGTYTTVRDIDGEIHETPACFLVEVRAEK